MEEDTAEDTNLFSVLLLGIIFDPEKRQILIMRGQEDPNIKNLTWSFPGGSANKEENLEESLTREIKEKTWQNIEILGSVFSMIPPEKKDLIIIYYLCEVLDGRPDMEESADLKWVKPEELRKYFTSSFEPVLEEYIINLK